MANNLYTFSPEFKRDCLAYLLKDQIAAKSVITHLPFDLFEYDSDFHVIFVAFKEFFTKFNNRPRKHELVDYITDVCDREQLDPAKRKAIFGALDEIWEWDQYSAAYVKEKLYDSVTAHSILKVARQIEEYVDQGEYDELVKAMAAARSTGTEDPDIIEYWQDTDERIKRRKTRHVQAIPTGFAVLDNFINGGLPRKCLAMLQGYSGLGKSALMAQMARYASLNGYTVAYLTLELDSDAVMDRVDAALTDIAVDHLIHKPKEVLKKLAQVYSGGAKRPNPFYVQYFPTKSISITQVERYVERLRTEKGRTLDLLVVDYFDLLRMEGSYSKKYEALEENCEMLRGLAGVYDMAVWTATQTNRGGMSKETVGMEDMSNAFGKIFPLDLLVTMSQTEEERKAKMFRLCIAKTRLGPANEVIYIQPRYSKMQFMDYDEAEARKRNLIVTKASNKKGQKKAKKLGNPVGGQP